MGQVASVIEGATTRGVKGEIDYLTETFERQQIQLIADKRIFNPLLTIPNLSTWCPAGYDSVLARPIIHTPSIPGRVNHELYGNCYLRAEIKVSRSVGEVDETFFLLTLVDAVKVDGVYTTKKRTAWYEIPKILLVNGIGIDFCDKVSCMIDTVDYDSTTPSQTMVTFVMCDELGNLSSQQLNIVDVLASKDRNIQKAFENFTFDYKNWVRDVNLEHVTAQSS